MATANGDALLSAASRTGVLLTADGASTEKEDSMHVELMRRGPEQSVCGCPGDADAKQTPDRIWIASSHRWQKGVCSARLARDMAWP